MNTESPNVRDNDTGISIDKISGKRYLKYYVPIFSILFVSLILSIISYYYIQKERLEKDTYNNLSYLADSKVKQIVDWRNERLNNAITIYKNNIVKNKIISLFENADDEDSRNDLIIWFKSYHDYFRYSCMDIIDREGNILLKYPNNSRPLDKRELRFTEDAISKRIPVLSDFHFYAATDTIHISLIIPIIDDSNSQINQLIFINIDPHDFLYPIIQNWPTESMSGEDILVEKSSNYSICLNDLRHKDKSALIYKTEMTDVNNLSVMAAQGILGNVRGLDYRGVEVIGVIRPIPQTDYYLITKIDYKEIFEPLERYSLIFFALIILIIITAVISIIFLINNIKVHYYKKVLDSELKRKAIQKNFEYALKYAYDMFFLFDENGNILDANERALTIYGYSKEEISNMNIRDLIESDYKENVENDFMNIRQSNGIIFESRHIRNDGYVFPVEISSRLIYINEKPFTHFIVRDITERKKYEEKLSIAKGKAEEMSRLKSNFLANMSHELRTPMVGILGFSDILAEELSDDEHIKMARQINESGTRLLDTLNKILDISRIEANKQEMNPAKTNITRAVSDFVEIYYAAAKKKNLYLRVNNNGKEVYSVLDAKMLNVIIDNLVNNAVIYTDQGGVEVQIDEDIINGKKNAVIRVIDTGIGIEEENAVMIFEEFRQVSEGMSRIFEGTGLGLSITKKFVELMNGTLSLESVYGSGSIFTVRFPLAEQNMISEKPNAAAADKVNFRKRLKVSETQYNNNNILPNILVIDDDVITGELLKNYLKGIFNVVYYKDGDNVLGILNGSDYSLVLLDINLGTSKSGIEILKEVKNSGLYNDMPIIALTALAMACDREMCLSEGFSDYISKPFYKDDLLNMVIKHGKKQSRNI
ncbi:MAG: PAS domain S-box protein [Ignavibacteria bacterium]|nr:PAS domain S-box protein [Ignavibacteria bacterium]